MQDAIDNEIDKLKELGEIYTLDELGIDLDTWAEVTKDNIDSLDDKTKEFLKKFEENGTLDSYLKCKYKKITVIVVKGADLKAARDALGFDNGNGEPRAMSVGDHVIINSDKISNSSNMNDDKASTLGYEIVHSIQADAYGGVVNFREAYEQVAKDAKDQVLHLYLDNAFEKAAWKLGGSNRTSPQHFQGNWWK